MRSSKSRLRIIIVLTGVFLATVPDALAQNLKVPFAALSPNYAPLWIAEQGGLFKKYGLEVQPIYISAGSVIIPAVLSGQMEVANMGSGPPLTAWARGAELVSVGVGSTRQLHVIMTATLWLIIRLDPPRSIALPQPHARPRRGAYPNRGLPERLGALKVGAVDSAILTGDTAFQAEKLGYHTVIDLSQLPIQYPGSTIVISKPFLQSRRDVVKRFMRGWVEGIKTVKTDKEFTIRVLQKYLKTDEREILAKTFEVYKNVHERIPYPDAKVMAVALKQLSATVPQASQLKAEDFIDRSIIAELENEGFIAKLYGGR